VGVVFVLVGFGASAAVARAADSVAPAPFRSAETCRPCHTGIYDEWRQSAMARTAVLAEWSLAMSLDTLEWTGEEEKIRELCYACHAPFARRTGALDLSTSPHREGVSCDYCHSVRAVEASPRINVATVVRQDRPACGREVDRTRDPGTAADGPLGVLCRVPLLRVAGQWHADRLDLQAMGGQSLPCRGRAVSDLPHAAPAGPCEQRSERADACRRGVASLSGCA
jgi:hypothetical protein